MVVTSPISSSQNQSGGRSSGAKNTGQHMTYINDSIKAFEVVVIDAEGENLGRMKRYDALQLALAQGLDLVQMSYNPVDKVCTAKLVDYGKYLYDQKKQKKENKSTANKGMKQMKFAYAIGTNDLLLKIKKIKEMLEDGYTVRVFVQLKGRQNIYKDKVIEKMGFIQEELKLVAKSQTPHPKQDKNTLSLVFSSLKR